MKFCDGYGMDWITVYCIFGSVFASIAALIFLFYP